MTTQSISSPIDLSAYEQINDSGYFINEHIQIGRGGYGQVFLGYSKHIHKRIAIKRIIPDHFDTYKSQNTESEIQSEIQIFLKLNSKGRHKNIVKYYGYQKRGHEYYIFLQYCANGSLKTYVKNKILTQYQIFHIFDSVLNGMIYINKLGIMHRDLAPKNILLDENKEVKICDFGISRQIPLLQQSNYTPGLCTPLYGAPEVILRKQYNQNCDVWTLGCVIYQLIQGKNLYFKKTFKKQEFKQMISSLQFDSNFPVIDTDLGKRFAPILRKMLCFNFKMRLTFKQLKKTIEYKQLRQQFEIKEQSHIQINEFTQRKFKQSPSKNSEYLEKYARYEQILFKYIKYAKEKNQIYLKLHKEFMGKPYQVLWNVQKYLLKFLTINMYIVKTQVLMNFLKNILETKTINMFGQIEIFVENNSKIDLQQKLNKQISLLQQSIEKYKEFVKRHATKIQTYYMTKDEERSRVKQQINIDILNQYLETCLLQNFMEYQVYHKEYCHLISQKQYYLSVQQVMNLPTLTDKEIYQSTLYIYHIDRLFDQKQYVKHLKSQAQSEEESKMLSMLNKTFGKTMGLTSNFDGVKKFYESTTSDQKQIVKWIKKYNIRQTK